MFFTLQTHGRVEGPVNTEHGSEDPRRVERKFMIQGLFVLLEMAAFLVFQVNLVKLSTLIEKIFHPGCYCCHKVI